MKEIDVHISGAINIFQTESIGLSEFLGNEEVNDIRDGKKDIEEYADLLNDYLASGDDNAELESIEEFDGETVVYNYVWDFQYDTDITVTEDMTTKEFENVIYAEYGDIPESVYHTNIGWCDVSVDNEDLHYPKGNYEYLTLNEDGRLDMGGGDKSVDLINGENRFEEFKKELFSYDAPEQSKRKVDIERE